MKSRGGIVCECCKQEIPAGANATRFAGRYWRTDHLLAYKARRREMRG